MSSTFRNAVQRRPHKERAQPQERGKWGILEKHKDYTLRAKDYNEKKKRLKSLRQKASERNPDEFHFAMMSSRTNNGQKASNRGNKILDHDIVKLLKTQDAGYLRNVAQRTKKLRERREEQFLLHSGVNLGSHAVSPHSTSNTVGPRHLTYVEQDVHKQERDDTISLAAPVNGIVGYACSTVAKDHSRPVNLDNQGFHTCKDDVAASSDKAARKVRKRRKREIAAKTHRLDTLRKRESDLAVAEHELQSQRDKFAGNQGGATSAGFKFKRRERRK